MPVSKKATAKRTAPKTAPKRAPKTAAKKTAAKKATAAKTATRGPSKETVAFAERVVKLRDGGLAWKAVAAKLGVPYTANGSSKLRRAYTIGGGATVGVRSAK